MQTPCLFRRSRWQPGRPWSALSGGESGGRRPQRGWGLPGSTSRLSNWETTRFLLLFRASGFPL